VSNRRSGTSPESELNRVRGVLHSLIDFEPLSGEAKEALMIGTRAMPKDMYCYLYEHAERYNPFDRKLDPKWKARCMKLAYSHKPTAPEHVVRAAKYAATFYLLAEGLYSQPRLPVLTY
jgi:hypothetical protein